MNLNRLIKMLFLLASVTGLVWIIVGCEYTDSNPIWDPNADLGPVTQIRTIYPLQKANAGIQEIDIRGKGFSQTAAKNSVYFGTTVAQIKASSDTQIVVYRPNTSSDSMTVKVMVEGAITFGKQTGYGVPEVAKLYGDIGMKNWVVMLAVDKDENAYTLLQSKAVTKITPKIDKTSFGTRKFGQKPMDMAVGSDGALYFVAAGTSGVHKIEATGGNSAKWADLSILLPLTFDFSAGGIIFAAGNKTGISVLLPDKSTRTLAEGSDVAISWLRIFKNTVYVTDGSAIYSYAISGTDGSLGSKQTVFNITQNSTYASSKILSFIMAEDGTFYVSTDHSDAVFVLQTNGSTYPMYKGILIPNGGQLVWGSGTYFYLNMTQNTDTNDLMRITMGTKSAGK